MSEETVEQSTTDQTSTNQRSTDQTSTDQTSTDQTSAEQSAAGTATPAAPKQRGYRKTRRGYVVSDKMDKTVVVEVEDRVKHPLYGKVLRRSEKVKAHDEAGDCGIGDVVLIMETRPLSAAKRWRVVEILERAK